MPHTHTHTHTNIPEIIRPRSTFRDDLDRKIDAFFTKYPDIDELNFDTEYPYHQHIPDAAYLDAHAILNLTPEAIDTLAPDDYCDYLEYLTLLAPEVINQHSDLFIDKLLNEFETVKKLPQNTEEEKKYANALAAQLFAPQKRLLRILTSENQSPLTPAQLEKLYQGIHHNNRNTRLLISEIMPDLYVKIIAIKKLILNLVSTCIPV